MFGELDNADFSDKLYMEGGRMAGGRWKNVIAVNLNITEDEEEDPTKLVQYKTLK